MKNSIAHSNPASANDAQLVEAARLGNRKAFVEIVSRYQNLVTGVTLAILRDFSHSEDAAQESFVLAWQKINSLKDPAKLRPWLAQIARHTALNHAKKKRPSEPLNSSLVDQNPRPDELAINRDEQSLVLSALESLPEKYRLPLVLYYREDQSIGTVAEALSQSESTIRKQLSRGRGLLKEQVAKFFGTGLARTSPGPFFTATVAGLIGAMLKPTAVAATAFSAQPLATAMTTSKLSLTTAAIITAVCLPIGYSARALMPAEAEPSSIPISTNAMPNRQEENETALSPLVMEWQQLLATCQNDPKAFPALYQTITELPGNLRREAFQSLLIVEWVKLDPVKGLAFIRKQNHSRWQQELFAKEWIQHDIHAAIDGLLKGGPGWDYFSKSQLADIREGQAWSQLMNLQLDEIIIGAPERFASVVQALPMDAHSRLSFAVSKLYQVNPEVARQVADQLDGKRRHLAWEGLGRGRSIENPFAALAWAKSNADPELRDSLISSVLYAQVWENPLRALEFLKDVPIDTRSIKKSALYSLAEKDFQAALSWVKKNPDQDNMVAFQSEFYHRLNDDPLALLNALNKANLLEASATVVAGRPQLHNNPDTRTKIWNWTLKLQNSPGARELRKEIASQSYSKDPSQLMRLVNEVSDVSEQNELIKFTAQNIVVRADILQSEISVIIDESNENWRPALIEEAFKDMTSAEFRELPNLNHWESYLTDLPDSQRPRAAAKLATGIAHRSPETMTPFFNSLKNESEHRSAGIAFVSEFQKTDPQGAAHWLANTPMSDLLRTTIQAQTNSQP